MRLLKKPERTSRCVLYKGDCLEVMKQIPDKSVDCVVTSPPYDNLRTYNNSSTWSFDIFKGIAHELTRVLADGGVIVWVVGDKTENGSETGTSFRQALYFKELGLNIHDTMIYIKKGGINKGSLKAYQQKFEYMFIFSKGKIKTFNLIKDRKNKVVEDRIKKVRQKDGTYKEQHFKSHEYGVRYNYWIYETGKNKDTNNFTHPAVFPLELAKDHIISWSNENDTVLDPLMGSGTTGVACKMLNRNFIGIEIDNNYYNIAKGRIDAVGKEA